MRKRMIIVAAAAALTAAGVAGGVAVAGDQGDDGPASRDYTQQEADRAEEAALDATGGGTANSVELDNENGATWEVEVTEPGGDVVDVRLDEDFDVVVVEGDDESPDDDD